MLKSLLKRWNSNILETPWRFRMQESPVKLKSIDPRLSSKFHSVLVPGFSYAFRAICEGLATYDKDLLKNCLEPKLFDRVNSDLSSMQENNAQFEINWVSEPEVTLYNLTLHMGVEISRYLNKSSKKYMKIANAEDIKDMISRDYIKEKVKEMGYPEELTDSQMDFAWFYLDPSAPANFVLQVDALYSGPGPLTLKREQIPAQLPDENKEFHIMRFESCPMHLGSQMEAMSKGGFKTLFNEISKITGAMLESDWVAVDIDNILEGNPHTI